MARTSRWRVAAAVGAVLALGGLAGCGGGSGGSTASDSVAGVDAPAPATAGLVESKDGAAGSADGSGANRTVVQTRAKIKTGEVTLTSKHLGAVRGEVEGLLRGFGGTIDDERTSTARDGTVERSVLVLRVPVASFKAAMDALEEVGTLRSSDRSAKDVTTQVIDVDERVQTLQNSVDRLQKFQRRSADINDLIRFEREITDRQAELQSLKAQQSYLADQTSMATITVTMSVPEKYVPPPDPLKDAGFWSGLKAGWGALVDTVVVALTVVGAVLPFAVALALAGVPVWLLVRRAVRGRRTPPAEPAEG